MRHPSTGDPSTSGIQCIPHRRHAIYHHLDAQWNDDIAAAVDHYHLAEFVDHYVNFDDRTGFAPRLS